MALFGMFGGKRARPLILHIDDSTLVLMTAQSMLAGLGYDTLQASGGDEGVKIAADKKPDLILVDAMMPEVDGYQTVANLRAQKETAATPIIMVTGDDSVKSVDLAMNSGANDYLVKPLKEERLKAKLDALIKR
jgi:two-component system alkaline phosphatase synthesis response regulator PhoP